MADQKIILESSDKQKIEFDHDMACKLPLVKDYLDNFGQDGDVTPFPLDKVRGEVLIVIKEWMSYHKDDVESSSESDSELGMDEETRILTPKWDRDFTSRLSKELFFETLEACNFLQLKQMEQMMCKTIAQKIKGHSVEYVREFLGLKSDFTKDEEDKIKKENEWAESLANDDEPETEK